MPLITKAKKITTAAMSAAAPDFWTAG